MQLRLAAITTFVGISALTTLPTLAAGPALEVGIGAGVSSLEGSLPEIDDSPSGRFHLNFSFPIIPKVEQLRLGLGFSVDGASETGPRRDVDFDGNDDRPYSNLVAFTPELKLAWSQPLGERWFIEPSIAIAAPIARYSIGDIEFDDDYYGDDVDVYEDEGWTTIGIGLRPALAVGYNLNEHHAIGLVGSYLIADIDFDDDIGGQYEALSLSFFYRVTF